MKKITSAMIALLLLCAAISAKAQPERLLSNDSLLRVFLTTSKYDVDTNADATVLFEKTHADITMKITQQNLYSQIMNIKYERCLKIRNRQAMSEADITIPYTKQLKAKDIQLMSFSLENGQIVRQKIEKPDLLKETYSGNIKMYKFRFPKLKEGSIVYYTFSNRMVLEEYAGFVYPISWDINGHYPVLDARLEITLPVETEFKVLQKNIQFADVKSADSLGLTGNHHFTSIYNTTRIQQWHATNIQAVTNEPMVIDHQLRQLTCYVSLFAIPTVRKTMKLPEKWEEANGQFFYSNIALGRWVFKQDDTLSLALNKISNGETDKLRFAKSIYRFVRDSFKTKADSDASVYKSQSTRELLRSKEGTNADKNIMLTAMYRRAGFKCFPVLLSTTGRGKLHEELFDPGSLNYVVAALIVNDRCYYLDASSKQLPFGIIKPECYNGFGWLVNESGIPVSMNADSLLDKSMCVATLKPGQKEGVFQMKMDFRLGNVTGAAIRETWAQDSTEASKALDRRMNQMKYKVKILDRTIANMNNPDTLLLVSYNLEVELAPSGQYIYLNPFFNKVAETNPFKDVQRKNAVELENALSSQFILKFTLPEGYTLEESEAPANLNFNNGAMTYNRSMLYDDHQRIFSLQNTYSTKTTRIDVEDYASLRSFYENMVADQNKTIVLKKVK